MPTKQDDGLEFVSTYAVPATTPETLTINGVTYRRENDHTDRQVNKINQLQEIAQRTGLSLKQVAWFESGFGDGTVMPD